MNAIPEWLFTEFSTSAYGLFLADDACSISGPTEEVARNKMPGRGGDGSRKRFLGSELYKKATMHGVKPIIECEVYVASVTKYKRSLRTRIENPVGF